MRIVCGEVLWGLVLALNIFQCQSGPRNQMQNPWLKMCVCVCMSVCDKDTFLVNALLKVPDDVCKGGSVT